MEVYFENIEKIICEKMKKADKVYVCAAWLTSIDIIEACAQVDAIVILNEDSKIVKGSPSYDNKLTAKLKRSFHKIYIYKSDRKLMHNKFIILFSDDVPYGIITGSYNFTIAANFNFENIIYVEDKSIANKYLQEFEKILVECKKFSDF
jgi:phosphatidylserine/phosphatidylglycerophosphate/cardiolipin synthase-like enzyme